MYFSSCRISSTRLTVVAFFKLTIVPPLWCVCCQRSQFGITVEGCVFSVPSNVAGVFELLHPPALDHQGAQIPWLGGSSGL